MCGIICIINPKRPFSSPDKLIDDNLKTFLSNRGPNLNSCYSVDERIYFSGFVLWQQGKCPSKQPLVTQENILLLNGDIFNAGNAETNLSDTEWLIHKLDMCKTDEEILELFRFIEGPYSLIFYNRKNQHLYVARDSLGRNSLLIESDGDTIRLLSTSCIPSRKIVTLEIPPLGIYKLGINEGISNVTLYPWKSVTTCQHDSVKIIEKMLGTKITLGQSINSKWLKRDENHEASYNFSAILNNLDKNQNIFEELLRINEISLMVTKLLSLIEESVKIRVITTPKLCSDCLINYKIESNCSHAKVGILFSGGIDCTILAIMMHNYIPITEPIELINVAFEKCSSNTFGTMPEWNVPDRISAQESYCELQKLCPLRQWNLVKVNVTREELQSMLNSHIKHIIYPLQTILDESLGCAFWFAARGKGELENEPYKTKSRVLLVGSGADELFGGYTRHRNAYLRCKGSNIEKFKSLENELNLDWERIPTRNLGRDDRVIADNGKTARAPFIEENLVKFVNDLHASEKCCFELEPGYGDKLLLRLCGYKLGLKKVSKLKKRAIQFGSRIADKNQNAKDISSNLI